MAAEITEWTADFVRALRDDGKRYEVLDGELFVTPAPAKPHQMDEGVPEYWIVDLDGRLVERWRQGDERPEIVTESLAWQPLDGVPALKLDLPRFFAGIFD